MFSIDKCNMLFMATNYVLVQVYFERYVCMNVQSLHVEDNDHTCREGSSSSNASQILKFLRMANFTTFEI